MLLFWHPPRLPLRREVADLAGGVFDHPRSFGSCRFSGLGCLGKMMVRPAADIADHFGRASGAFTAFAERLLQESKSPTGTRRNHERNTHRRQAAADPDERRAKNARSLRMSHDFPSGYRR